MNVRLFALPTGVPPDSWKVPTYVTAYRTSRGDLSVRRHLRDRASLFGKVARRVARAFVEPTGAEEQAARWLADVVREWQPHVVHILGLDPAGFFVQGARDRFGIDGSSKWVLQLRGGSDLALAQHDPEVVPKITRVLGACDQLLSDNSENFAIAARLGMSADKIAPIAPVPGTGGVDVAKLAATSAGPPSSRRVILWPKAYECPWSKAMPVLEALTLCWDRIQPCEVYMLASTPDVAMWYRALPENIRRHCHLTERIPRDRVLELMGQARVLLAPSLIDGTPNTLFEAMVYGALPIVSPLKTITPLVREPDNVLFARNLYPDEIASALVRAMTDDDLVENAARNNIVRVREIADRSRIRARVVDYYEQLAC